MKWKCLLRNWIYLLQNCFRSYAYLKDIYKTLKGIEKTQFVSEITIYGFGFFVFAEGMFTKPCQDFLAYLLKLRYC